MSRAETKTRTENLRRGTSRVLAARLSNDDALLVEAAAIITGKSIGGFLREVAVRRARDLIGIPRDLERKENRDE